MNDGEVKVTYNLSYFQELCRKNDVTRTILDTRLAVSGVMQR